MFEEDHVVQENLCKGRQPGAARVWLRGCAPMAISLVWMAQVVAGHPRRPSPHGDVISRRRPSPDSIARRSRLVRLGSSSDLPDIDDSGYRRYSLCQHISFHPRRCNQFLRAYYTTSMVPVEPRCLATCLTFNGSIRSITVSQVSKKVSCRPELRQLARIVTDAPRHISNHVPPHRPDNM